VKSSLKHNIYWNAPSFVKNWMASFHARKLDRQRYGLEYQQSLIELAKHDKWSAEYFAEYQREQVVKIIRHAATKVPYYRNIFTELNIQPDSITQLKHLPRLPILEKEVVRSNPKSLVDETLKIKDLFLFHTSGTTGTPLDIYGNVWSESTANACAELRWYAAAGMTRRHDCSATICGHLVVDPEQTKPPFWVYNKHWNQLYMSSYHLSEKNLGYYVDELRRFQPTFIEGYPSSVYAIAKYMVDNKLEPVSLKACFTTSETLYNYHRDVIKRAFECRTYDQYGSAELVVFAAECSAGSMHLSPEIGIVEVVDDNNQPVAPGQMGQLICTSLINYVQPLIRYRIGDTGTLDTDLCSCGSPLPVLASLEGRTDDILITHDGLKIGRLDPMFKGVKGIIEAQIVQDDYDKFRVRLVPGNQYTKKDEDMIINNLIHRVGKVEIKIERVESIDRTSSGKFRAVICNLTKQRQ